MVSIINAFLDDFIPNWHNRKGHVRYHILVLVTEGRLHYRLNERPLEAAKGDLLFIPTGTCREAFNGPEAPHQKYAILFNSGPGSELPLLENGVPCKYRVKSFEFMKDRFVLLYRQYVERKSYFDTIGRGALLEILGTLSRELAAPAIPGRRLQHVHLLEQYMLQHFREAIPLKTLAGQINRSPNYTISLFKSVIGMTPIEYQHQLRINAAIDMLRHTDLTIAAIAEYLGYYDASSFHRMFRKKTGLPPSAYSNA